MRKASCLNAPQKGYSPRRSGSLPRVEGEQGFLRQFVVITAQKIRNGFPGKHVGADGISCCPVFQFDPVLLLACFSENLT